MRGRVVTVDATPENGDRHAPGVESSAMGLAVDASSHPAHDDEPGRSEVPRQRSRDRATVRGAGARAHQRNRGSVEERRVRGSAKEEGWRRIVDRGKQRRKAGVAAAD